MRFSLNNMPSVLTLKIFRLLILGFPPQFPPSNLTLENVQRTPCSKAGFRLGGSGFEERTTNSPRCPERIQQKREASAGFEGLGRLQTC